MKKQSFASIAAMAVIALLTASGCTTSMSMPGAMMQSNIPLKQGGYTILNDGKPVTGSAKSVTKINGFGMMRDDSEQSSRWRSAIDQALAQCPGADALINITTDVKMKTTMYPYIGGKIEYETFVTGTPVKIIEE